MEQKVEHGSLVIHASFCPLFNYVYYSELGFKWHTRIKLQTICVVCRFNNTHSYILISKDQIVYSTEEIHLNSQR